MEIYNHYKLLKNNAYFNLPQGLVKCVHHARIQNFFRGCEGNLLRELNRFEFFGGRGLNPTPHL